MVRSYSRSTARHQRGLVLAIVLAVAACGGGGGGDEEDSELGSSPAVDTTGSGSTSVAIDSGSVVSTTDSSGSAATAVTTPPGPTPTTSDDRPTLTISGSFEASASMVTDRCNLGNDATGQINLTVLYSGDDGVGYIFQLFGVPPGTFTLPSPQEAGGVRLSFQDPSNGQAYVNWGSIRETPRGSGNFEMGGSGTVVVSADGSTGTIDVDLVYQGDDTGALPTDLYGDVHLSGAWLCPPPDKPAETELVGPEDVCEMLTQPSVEAFMGTAATQLATGNECVYDNSDSSMRVYLQRATINDSFTCGDGAKPVAGLGDSAEELGECLTVTVGSTVFMFGGFFPPELGSLEPVARAALATLG